MKSETAPNQESVTKGEKTLLLDPYKDDIFSIYVIWKSLPVAFKIPPVNRHTGMRPSPRDYCEGMGIEDEQIIDLVGIKSQAQFAERFGVHINTLTDWNKLIVRRDLLADIRHWAVGLTKNVLMSLYNKILQEGDAARVKLWMQIVHNWSEKRTVESGYRGVTSITYQIIEPDVLISGGKPQEALIPTI